MQFRHSDKTSCSSFMTVIFMIWLSMILKWILHSDEWGLDLILLKQYYKLHHLKDLMILNISLLYDCTVQGSLLVCLILALISRNSCYIISSDSLSSYRPIQREKCSFCKRKVIISSPSICWSVCMPVCERDLKRFRMVWHCIQYHDRWWL